VYLRTEGPLWCVDRRDALFYCSGGRGPAANVRDSIELGSEDHPIRRKAAAGLEIVINTDAGRLARFLARCHDEGAMVVAMGAGG
jgi:hypothetical protein